MIPGCGNQLVKFFIFATNFFLFLFGGIVFGVSLWANLDKNFLDHLEEFAQKVKLDDTFVRELSKYEGSLWVLVVIGALLLFVGFFGCCGASCESILYLTLFVISVFVLCVVEILTFVFLFTNRAQLYTALHDILVKSSQTPEGRSNLLPVEKALKCCGATVETASFYKDDCIKADTVGQPDCYTIVTEYLSEKTETMLIFGIGLLVIQAVVILLSCRLITQKRAENREVQYVPQHDEENVQYDRQYQ